MDAPHKWIPCRDYPGWEIAEPWERGADTNGGHAHCTLLRRKGYLLSVTVEASTYGRLILNVIARIKELEALNKTSPEFERVCRDFTHQIEVAANWRERYFGASLRTRVTQAIADLRAACDRMEKIIAEDRA